MYWDGASEWRMEAVSIINKIRNRFSYIEYSPLIYSEELRDAYLSSSVVGGRLCGKTVFITGGAGGIGTAIALRFAKEGCRVIIAGRNAEKLKKTVDYIKKKIADCDVRYSVLDIVSEESIQFVMNELKSHKGFIDILVNNAGILMEVDKKRTFRDVSETEFLSGWNTNFEGTKAMIDSVASIMAEKQIEGSIINISSICADSRKFQYTPYGMAKCAIAEYSEYMRKNYSSLNICCIKPGSVATAMVGFELEDNIAGKSNGLNHLALPEEIAACTAFLAAGFGKYLNKTHGEITVSASENL